MYALNPLLVCVFSAESVTVNVCVCVSWYACDMCCNVDIVSMFHVCVCVCFISTKINVHVHVPE